MHVFGVTPLTECRPAVLIAAGLAVAVLAAPLATDSKWARSAPVRPSASATSLVVSLRAVRLTPRSRSLIERTLTLAA